ncbi:MAG: polyisoprenoid-binding protein [Blastocatellia bacterium]
MRKIVILLLTTLSVVFAFKFSLDTEAGVGLPDEKILKAVEAGTYEFDKAHSFIGFRIKHMGLIEVPGYFRDFQGTVKFDATDITRSTVEFTAKTTSVDTGVAARDNHLRTADFFDVEKFPEMTFKSTKVEKRGKSLILTGDLTIKGITRSVSVPFEITGWLPAGERNPAKMGISGETVINRRDFGVTWGGNLPNGVPALSDEVKVTLQIEAAKASAK